MAAGAAAVGLDTPNNSERASLEDLALLLTPPEPHGPRKYKVLAMPYRRRLYRRITGKLCCCCSRCRN